MTYPPIRMWLWIHRRLEDIVRGFGDVPVAGKMVWWMLGEWQRFAP